MAEKFRIENGLLLRDYHTLVEFADGCADGGGIVPGAHEAGEVVPCPDCAGEHRITSALRNEDAASANSARTFRYKPTWFSSDAVASGTAPSRSTWSSTAGPAPRSRRSARRCPTAW